MVASSGNIERDIEDIVRILDQITGRFDRKTLKMVMDRAAQPMLATARRLAPKHPKAHSMYNTPKLSNNLRAPKGMGVKSATFQPGNLSRAIQIMAHGPFKRSAATYIGPRYPIGTKKNVAPYAHMVEFGTAKQKAQPYMRPAFESMKEMSYRIARTGLGVELGKVLKQNGIKA
jgi:HK97 gp10 family phage protein